MQIYTDGSKDEQNSCGSGIFIKAPNCSHNIKIRNSDFCSVFRSELIAIDEALRIIKTMTSPDEIWILCDSRSAIQHLSDWTNVGDKTSVSILKNLKELSQQHEIYFQWIPSHIGLFGNDTADLLAKEGVTENLMSRRTLTFSEIFSKTKSLIQELWKTPPTHPLATPDHLLFCAGLEREDIYSSPLLVTATAGSDVVQSGRPIFDDFLQHLWPYIGNNTANVVFPMVKRLWLIRIDQ
ncbi:putative RNA-directed DNA polymerase from transposon BS [Trichonephila clavipes]|nr:putative RNA-directed DNA polymerase from transposon BS [Trichonephila clavipes]